jgi:hypothetical protein
MKTSNLEKAFLIRCVQQLDQAACAPILLRNYGDFPNEIGNDLDVYVHPDKIADSFRILSECASAHNGVISHIHKRGYFIAIWLRFADNNHPIHIDLYYGALTWHGIKFLNDAELVLAAQSASKGASYKVPSPAHEALVSCLASILWGGFFKARYQEHVSFLLSDNTAYKIYNDNLIRCFGDLGNALGNAVRQGNASEFVNPKFARALRSRLIKKSLSETPVKFILHYSRHWIEEASCYLHRLPGVVVEYDKGQWQSEELSTFRDLIEPYFGQTHMWFSEAKSLTQKLDLWRLRGKNHLVLIAGRKFRINGETYSDLQSGNFVDPLTLSSAVLSLLSERLKFQYSYL